MGTPTDDEVDFADEAPEFDEAGGYDDVPEGDPSSESGLDFGAEASSDDDVYEADLGDGEADPEALEGLAEDAGDEASYGFEAAHVSFSGGDTEGLGEDTGVPDSYDEYEMQDTGGVEDVSYADEAEPTTDSGVFATDSSFAPPEGDAAVEGFAEEANVSDGPDFAADAPADDGYADDGYADDGYADDGYADDGYADDGYADDGYADDGYADDDDDGAGHLSFTAPTEETSAAEPEPEPEEEADVVQGFASAGSSSEEDDGVKRSGQIAKSALDEIFARAAQIKRKKPGS